MSEFCSTPAPAQQDKLSHKEAQKAQNKELALTIVT
jgi:hypothetical protein